MQIEHVFLVHITFQNTSNLGGWPEYIVFEASNYFNNTFW
jgi:hypothetical protein